MAVDTLTNLQNRIDAAKAETKLGGNSKTRVFNLLDDIVDTLKSLVDANAEADSIPIEIGDFSNDLKHIIASKLNGNDLENTSINGLTRGIYGVSAIEGEYIEDASYYTLLAFSTLTDGSLFTQTAILPDGRIFTRFGEPDNWTAWKGKLENERVNNFDEALLDSWSMTEGSKWLNGNQWFFVNDHANEDIADLFGLNVGDVISQLQIKFTSTGLRYRRITKPAVGETQVWSDWNQTASKEDLTKKLNSGVINTYEEFLDRLNNSEFGDYNLNGVALYANDGSFLGTLSDGGETTLSILASGANGHIVMANGMITANGSIVRNVSAYVEIQANTNPVNQDTSGFPIKGIIQSWITNGDAMDKHNTGFLTNWAELGSVLSNSRWGEYSIAGMAIYDQNGDYIGTMADGSETTLSITPAGVNGHIAWSQSYYEEATAEAGFAMALVTLEHNTANDGSGFDIKAIVQNWIVRGDAKEKLLTKRIDDYDSLQSAIVNTKVGSHILSKSIQVYSQGGEHLGFFPDSSTLEITPGGGNILTNIEGFYSILDGNIPAAAWVDFVATSDPYFSGKAILNSWISYGDAKNFKQDRLKNGNATFTDDVRQNIQDLIAIGFSFRGANLEGASLEMLNATGADFRDANLESAYLDDSTLVEADFSGANLINASLQYCVLVSAKLKGANCTGAGILGSNFIHADLRDANFSACSFSSSPNYWYLTKISGANFTDAVFDDGQTSDPDIAYWFSLVDKNPNGDGLNWTFTWVDGLVYRYNQTTHIFELNN